MKESATIVKFINEEGKEVIVNIKINSDETMDINLDFGEEGAENHKGEYVAICRAFVDMLTGK